MPLMVAGVGLFGGLSGLVASFLFGAREQKAPEQTELLERLEQLRRTLHELKSLPTGGAVGGSVSLQPHAEK